jgi:peptide/nickel transport system substrate-binding protein
VRHPGLALVLALALVAVAGCQRGPRTAPGEIVVLIEDPPQSLDPRFVGRAYDVKIGRLITGSLVSVDNPRLEPRPELAERIERRGDLTYEITLRVGLRFSDGTPVTAEDIAYTLTTIADPAFGSTLRAMTDRIARTEVLSARTVRITLTEPHAPFITDLDLGVVPRHLTRHHGGRFPGDLVVGAGPFRLAHRDATRIVLEPNPHYVFGPPKVRVVFKVVRDPNSRLLVLVGGSADLTQNTVPPLLIDAVERRPELRVERGRGAVFTYLVCNTSDPALADVRVRRALAHAIDRERLVRSKLHGRAEVATGLLPSWHWAYHGAVPRYGYDPARARALLAEAGARPRLVYKTSSDRLRVAIAQVIAHELREVGFEVEVRSYELATVLDDLKKGNFQIATLQLPDVVEPQLLQRLFHSAEVPRPGAADGRLNRSRYADPALDTLLDAGARELDGPRRRAIYATAQERLADALPVVPLWHEDNVVVMRRDVRGYEMQPNARLGALARAWKAR